MLFFSPYAAFRVSIRPESIFYHPTTGVELNRVPALRAEFAQQMGSEYAVKDPLSGEMTTHATIIGNYFDTDIGAQDNRWTDDEKDAVENRLLWLCDRRPDLIRNIEFKAPTVVAPWPTYDTMQAAETVKFAIAAGLVNEALAYERTKQQRPAVTSELEAILDREFEGEPPPPQNVVEEPRPKLRPAKGGEPRDATGSHAPPASDPAILV